MPAEGKSVDVCVQHTSDESLLSKRSAALQGYVVDNYLGHYVKKVVRRTPLINRGYYLRVEGMTRLVRLCVDAFTDQLEKRNEPNKTVQVLSLGAGYDTLAARHYQDPKYAHVRFFEVDFPDVIRNKTGLTKLAPEGSFPFIRTVDGAVDYKGYDLENGTMHFHRYQCLGLDLRETPKALLPLLQLNGFEPNLPTVVYAECVMQYMTPEVSTSVVKWVVDSLPQAFFMAYDQLNPHDSFGKRQTGALQFKCSPLLGIWQYPHGEALTKRAVQAGLAASVRRDHIPQGQQPVVDAVGVNFVNFYDLSRELIDGEEKSRLDGLELFDEWEGWAEMSEHYGILCGRTVNNPCLIPSSTSLKSVAHRFTNPKEEEMLGVGHCAFKHSAWPRRDFNKEGFGMGVVGETICGAKDAKAADDFIVVTFGGIATHSGCARTNAVSVHSLRDGDWTVLDSSSSEDRPSPRLFHSFTRVAPWTYVVFGGRAAPNTAYDDAFMLTLSAHNEAERTVTAAWKRLAQTGTLGHVPCARFRHTAESLAPTTIAVIGGRENGPHRLDDIWIGSISIEASAILWTQVTPERRLPPLCSHASAVVGTNNVVVAGGMVADGVATAKAWRLAFTTSADGKWSVVVSELRWSIGERFSHTLTTVDEGPSQEPSLLVLGGSGCRPKNQDNLLAPMIIAFPLSDQRATVMEATLPNELRHTTFTLHRTLVFKPSQGAVPVFAVLSGGMLCFSFGQYNVQPTLLCFGGDDPLSVLGLEPSGVQQGTCAAVPNSQMSSTPLATSCVAKRKVSVTSFTQFHLQAQHPRKLGVAVPYTADAWCAATAGSHPTVLTGMPVGSAVEKWASPEFLVSTLNAQTSDVPVCVAPKSFNLDVANKNFETVSKPFTELVEHCFPATPATTKEAWYYNSALDAKVAPDVFTDFMVLCEGGVFALPVEVPPRPSYFGMYQRKTQVWIHNVEHSHALINVVGKLRVVLFPPSQYGNLYIQGSASPVINIDSPNLAKYPRYLEAHQSSKEFTLGPGDVLVIPARWYHQVTALEASIAVGVSLPPPSSSLEGPAGDLPSVKDELLQEVKARLGDQALGASKELRAFTLRQLIADLEIEAAALEPKVSSASSTKKTK